MKPPQPTPFASDSWAVYGANASTCYLTLLGLILNEGHLRKSMKQYQAYFNHARPHQGIDQHIPCP